MAKNNIRDYSTSAASNTDIGGIGTLGSNAVGNFDNAFRELMAQLANWNAGTSPIMDTATFCDPADATKMLRLDAGNITTATTRVLTMPDENVTISSFGASLVDDADSTAARTTLLAQIALSNTRSVQQASNLSGSADCYHDFFAGVTGTYSARIVRESGDNGNLLIAQAGTGHIEFIQGAVAALRMDGDATNKVLIFVNGVLKRVSVGAADSGGAGFRALIVPN